MKQSHIRELISKLDALADPAKNPNAAERKVADEKAAQLREKLANCGNLEEVWRGSLSEMLRTGVLGVPLSAWAMDDYNFADTMQAARKALAELEGEKGDG